MSTLPDRRIEYAGSVHDEREVEAVLEVLRGGPTALRIGKNVRRMEQRVAELFAKRKGVMVNSGSSALYLAIEVLDLEPGDEIVTAAVTFSTDIAPMVRKGIVPAFVDVTPDTYQIDVDAIEEMITPRTKAILTPNLIGNAPDWDVIREIADRLMRVAAERALRHAPILEAPHSLWEAFAARFPYTETDDQLSAIADVVTDLERARPWTG